MSGSASSMGLETESSGLPAKSRLNARDWYKSFDLPFQRHLFQLLALGTMLEMASQSGSLHYPNVHSQHTDGVGRALIKSSFAVVRVARLICREHHDSAEVPWIRLKVIPKNAIA